MSTETLVESGNVATSGPASGLTMRWQVRKNNHVLHVFDKVQYTADIAFPANQSAQAKQYVDLLNAKEIIAEHREVLQALATR